jgi:endoglucanase
MSMAALMASALLATSLPAMEPAGQWAAFRARFVTASGRVRDTGNDGITHSEGQAYAMLIAATLGYRADFDRIWSWTKRHLGVRSDHLLAWRWDPAEGRVTDANNASDGDLVAAWALVRAARRWPMGGYQRDAASLLDAIEQRLVAPGSFGPVLTPGVDGFRLPAGQVLNLSYWVFPAFQEIALARPAGPWRRLARTGRELLDRARFGPLGLPPDWILVGDDVQPAPDRPARFGYDALRIPLYACWARLADLPVLAAIDTAWRENRPPAWVALDSPARADWPLGAGGLSVRAMLARCLGTSSVEYRPVEGAGDYYESVVSLLASIAWAEVGP